MTVIVFTDIGAFAANIFYIERPVLGMEFVFEYEEEIREGPFISRVDQTKDLTEELNILTAGWIYHPALAVYSLEYSPEWNQVRRQTSGAQSSTTSRSDSFLQGYDAELVLLSYKPYTLTLFARRENDSLSNNFTGRTIRKETSYGSLLALKYSILPTTINYIHSESQRSGFFTEERNRDQVNLVSSNLSKLGTVRLSGVYIKSDQTTINNAVDTVQQVYNLSHTRSFLENNQAYLNSSLSYSDTINNDNTNREIAVIETFSWRHRKNLITRYSFNYRDRELIDALKADATDIETVSGNFNLNHLLYENLSTNFNAGAIRIRNTGNEELQYDAGVDFHYDRDVPVGKIQVDMGQHISVNEVNFSSDFNHVIDESVSLVSAFTFLEKEGIDITSIVLKDDMGTIYPEVGNYVLSSIGTLTRVRCILGGQLDVDLDCSAGAPVLISYDYRIKFPFDYLTYNQSYGVTLNLENTVNMFYRFKGSEQFFLRGIRSSTDKLLDEQSHFIGMALIVHWSETNMSYENKQSTIVPLERVAVNEVITLQPNYYSVIRISLGYSKTKYINETEDLSYVNMNYEKVLSGRAKFSAESFYNKISNANQNTIDKGLLVALDWIYRIYSGRITYSYSQIEDQIVRDIIKNKYILFSVNRELF